MIKEKEIEYYRQNVVPNYKKLVGTYWLKCRICGLLKPEYEFNDKHKHVCIDCKISIMEKERECLKKKNQN